MTERVEMMEEKLGLPSFYAPREWRETEAYKELREQVDFKFRV